MSDNVEREQSGHSSQQIAAEVPASESDTEAGEPASSAGTPAAAPVPYKGSQPAPAASDLQQDKEAEALQSLYRQAVHLTEPEPEYEPDGPITRMTHHELRAMRTKTSTEVEVKAPFKETVANFVIRSFDEFLQSFKKAGTPRRLKCLDVGHECIHCGKQFAVEAKKAAKEKAK